MSNRFSSDHFSPEARRRLIHLAFGLGAFLVDPLGRWGAASLALCALLYNALLAPRLRLDGAYRRENEGHFGGLVTYPLAVLLLVLFARAPVAAGAWIILAVVDPVAAFVGSRVKGPRIPRNPRKSLAGSGAGFLAGALACGGALLLMGYPPLPAGIAAAAAGATAEALPLPVDDNLPIAAAAALALHFTLA